MEVLMMFGTRWCVMTAGALCWRAPDLRRWPCAAERNMCGLPPQMYSLPSLVTAI